MSETTAIMLRGQLADGIRAEWLRSHFHAFGLRGCVAISTTAGRVDEASRAGVASGDEQIECCR